MIAKRRRVLSGYGAMIGLCGTTILFKDLILGGTLDVLWADNFDSRLIYWIVNWGYHILFEQRQPFGFWDANSFYPNTMTLAYSDSLLGMQLLFAPLRILGFSSLTSLYLTLAGFCVIGAILTEYALQRIGYFSSTERLLITFSAHFGLGVTSFLVHYQLFGFQLAPSFFLFLYLYLRDLKQKDLFILVFIFAVGISIAMYLAPMLLVLSIPICMPIVGRKIKHGYSTVIPENKNSWCRDCCCLHACALRCADQALSRSGAGISQTIICGNGAVFCGVRIHPHGFFKIFFLVRSSRISYLWGMGICVFPRLYVIDSNRALLGLDAWYHNRKKTLFHSVSSEL